MKNLVVFLIFILNVNLINAQFLHLKVNEKSEVKSTILFLDGSQETGYIKNNKSKNIPLRFLELYNDQKAFSKPEIFVDYINFKKENTNEYDRIDIKVIDKIMFHYDDSNYATFKKIDFQEVNLKKREIKDQFNTIFLIDKNLSGFERYYYAILNKTAKYGSSKSYSFYVKHPVNGVFYHLNKTPYTSRKSLFNFFKIIGSECPEFIEYVDKLNNRKSIESKQMDEAEAPYSEPLIEALDRQKFDDFEDYFVEAIGIRFDFYFAYLSEKYVSFNCAGSEQLKK